MGSPLNRSDVQALILEPYRFPISRHVFFSSGNDNKTGARQFLSEWTPRVTHGSSDLSISPERVLFNIGVTWTGLVKLGAFDDLGGAEAAEKAFFWDFRKPPDPNSLRAYGSSVPANWWNKKFASSDIELVLHIYSTTDAALDSFTGALQTSAHANRMLGLTPTKDGGRSPVERYRAESCTSVTKMGFRIHRSIGTICRVGRTCTTVATSSSANGLRTHSHSQRIGRSATSCAMARTWHSCGSIRTLLPSTVFYEKRAVKSRDA